MRTLKVNEMNKLLVLNKDNRAFQKGDILVILDGNASLGELEVFPDFLVLLIDKDEEELKYLLLPQIEKIDDEDIVILERNYYISVDELDLSTAINGAVFEIEIPNDFVFKVKV